MEINIDNKSYEVEKDSTILEVCKLLKIDIPTLCYDERITPHSACRMCLVEVEGAKNLVTSCSTKVKEGMVISTGNEKVRNARRDVLDLLLSNHPMECLNCEKSGTCKLQNYAYEYDLVDGTFEGETRKDKIDSSNPFYSYDPEKCILCGLCVRVCSELQCSHAIAFEDRGFDTIVTTPFREGLRNSECVSCGNCVSVCPVGALVPKSLEKFRHWETKQVRTTCSYCGVGCQMDLTVKGDKVLGVEPAFDGTNEGLLCVKGKFAYKFISNPDRIKTPLIKKNGKFVEASWEEAYRLIKQKAISIKDESGADSFAGLTSARCTNEDNYLFQKMFRAVIGTNNVDHCARLCHSSTVAGLATTLGSGAMTNTIKEVQDNECMFVIGTNTTENHPVIGAMMKQAKEKGSKLIVADPRKIELSRYADVYLQIHPGTNIALLNGMMNVIVEKKLYDKEYIDDRTENFEELVELVKEYTPERVAKICGINKEDLIKAATIYGEANTAAIYYAMGITQHSTGTHGVMSISNLALMCGNIGKKYGGVNPLRGQNNVQGACDMGGLPADLPGYQKVFKEEIVEKFETAWDVKLSTKVGLTIPEILDGCEDDSIRFLYIMGENPMVSDPDINHVRKSLNNVDFLVVQDIFLTETAELADVILPASSFAEKDGTFTNTERRVQRVRKAIDPIGCSKPDWQIIMEIMNTLGYKKKYLSASNIMDEIASVTPQYGGISYKRLEKDPMGLQWPCLDENHPGTLYLHKEAIARGRGLFMPAEYVKSAELPDKEYPFTFTTGRILYHYHTRSMTGRVDGLNELAPHSYVEINETTARKMGINDGDMVKLSSRRGEIETAAKITNIIDEEVLFMPFHYAEGAANYLTNTSLDSIAKIPELKVAAVRMEKAL